MIAIDDQLGTPHTGFVRKVFALIGTQVLLTVAVVTYAMTHKDVGDFLLDNTAILVVATVVLLVTSLLPICWKPAGRKVPLNYIILYTFVSAKQTFSAAILVAYPCLLEEGEVVIAAGVLTFVVAATLILSVFAVIPTQCSLNFQISTCVLTILFSTSITWFILSILLPQSGWIGTGLCALGALIFGVYIIIDTAMIIEGGKYGLGNDDYVFAAIIIYLDLMNLFLRILRILSKLKSK